MACAWTDGEVRGWFSHAVCWSTTNSDFLFQILPSSPLIIIIMTTICFMSIKNRCITQAPKLPFCQGGEASARATITSAGAFTGPSLYYYRTTEGLKGPCPSIWPQEAYYYY